MSRIEKTFNKLKEQKKTAFISFVTGGDPDLKTSAQIINSLPKNGTDIIEIGIPFLDPAGDGPVIDAASKRAVKNGATLRKILSMVSEFRLNNQETPIILMGYYNSILHYGLEDFSIKAKEVGVDGILIVDLPIEEDDELRSYCLKNELALIKLVTPTSDEERIKKIVVKASGFIYFVCVNGITGTKSSKATDSQKTIAKIKSLTDIPVVIGFGIKTKDQVKEMSKTGADGVVVGSKLVSIVEEGLNNSNQLETIRDDLLKVNKELCSD
jgi:tryptophan synthase alpha chain